MSPNEVSELASVAEALNTESNEVNTIIANLNAKVAALNIGIEEWLYPEEDHIQIGWAKVDDKWQLSTRYCEKIRLVTEPDPSGIGQTNEHFEPEPGTEYTVASLLQASREVRLRALGHIQALIEKLHNAAKASVEKIREAKALAAEFAKLIDIPIRL